VENLAEGVTEEMAGEQSEEAYVASMKSRLEALGWEVSKPVPPPAPVSFDGCIYLQENWRDAPLIYLAKKAREGDADAAAALSAFQITVKDVDGKLYWPVS
jgi:hypothetical protein